MIDLANSHFTILLAGIAFFHFGMSTVSQSLEKLMASRISNLLSKISKNRFLSIGVGILLTAVLQSSGAVTSMLVSLGSAQVISLREVMGVIIGTAIGSTLTVQLISFNWSQYALPTFIIAFAVHFFSKNVKIKSFAMVFIGFALLFFGVGLISEGAHYFSNLEPVQAYIHTLHENPLIAMLIAMCFCAFVQSSAITIGLAMSLAHTGAISVEDALYWVYGANIGTTSTALLASLNSNYIGKQVAWAHFFYKGLSVCLMLIGPINQYFAQLLLFLSPAAERSVADGHLLFNVLSAMLFFPFIEKGAHFVEKLFPKSVQDEFGTEYLSLDNYHSSSVAISYANREIMRTADFVLSMIEDSIKMFNGDADVMIKSIKARDNKVDYLYRETKMFLLDHANNSTVVVHQNVMDMIMFLSNLERSADIIDLNLTNLALKKLALRLDFSPEGWDDICNMHQSVVKVARVAISSFNSRDLCDEAIRLKRELAKLELTLREQHVARLNRGLRDTINTSSIHLDLLSEYKHIASLLCSHAYKQ